MESFPKLFIPGPTFVPNHVMQSLTSPQIGHRTGEFSELMSTVVSGIQKVLYTNNHVYLASHAATGLCHGRQLAELCPECCLGDPVRHRCCPGRTHGAAP